MMISTNYVFWYSHAWLGHYENVVLSFEHLKGARFYQYWPFSLTFIWFIVFLLARWICVGKQGHSIFTLHDFVHSTAYWLKRSNFYSSFYGPNIDHRIRNEIHTSPVLVGLIVVQFLLSAWSEGWSSGSRRPARSGWKITPVVLILFFLFTRCFLLWNINDHVFRFIKRDRWVCLPWSMWLLFSSVSFALPWQLPWQWRIWVSPCGHNKLTGSFTSIILSRIISDPSNPRWTLTTKS